MGLFDVIISIPVTMARFLCGSWLSLKLPCHADLAWIMGGGCEGCGAECRLREVGGVFAEATCLAIACPACMTLELAQSCASYVTTIINGHDMIPTLSPGTFCPLCSIITSPPSSHEHKPSNTPAFKTSSQATTKLTKHNNSTSLQWKNALCEVRCAWTRP